MRSSEKQETRWYSGKLFPWVNDRWDKPQTWVLVTDPMCLTFSYTLEDQHEAHLTKQKKVFFHPAFSFFFIGATDHITAVSDSILWPKLL